MTPRRERGMVLLAVLVIITIAALIGSTLLVTVDAERSGAQTTLRRTQTRALAWSGAQLVMAQFAEQREKMLSGEDIDITDEWELFTDEFGRTAVIRLMPVGPDGQVFVSETAKLDINHATKEMLAAVPGIATEERAQKIIDARPFSSVEELVRVDGFAADLLYGFSDTPESLLAAPVDPVEGQPSPSPMPAGDLSGLEGAGAPALIDLLTVFSFDPNVQAGLQDKDKLGKLRVNLNVPWSDRLAKAIADQWGEETVQVAEQVFKSGMTFQNDQQLIGNVMQMGVTEADQIAPLLDAITTSDDMYRLGRVDIMRAPAEVLDALPGIDLATAYEIIDARERLSDEERLSPTWIVQEDLMTLENFVKLSDFVTTRSSQWRVRVEAGYRSADAIASVAGVADSVTKGLAEDWATDDALEDSVIYDIVIDAASERPRIAYLREVTLLELARALRTQDIGRKAGSDREQYDDELAAALGLEDPLATAGAEPAPTDADDSVGTPEESQASLDRAARRAARDQRRTQARPDRTAAPEPEPAPEATMPGEPVDRRIGRWRSGGGS